MLSILQVESLHASLEQERSKSKSLKSELAKLQVCWVLILLHEKKEACGPHLSIMIIIKCLVIIIIIIITVVGNFSFYF